MRASRHLLASALLALGLHAPMAFAALPDHFESPPVHPIELSPSGNLLFAVHTADHHLVVFDVSGAVPVRVAEVPVGLEPVTVRARNEDEVWVVNHLSDSISVVDVPTGRIVRTLLVGDEPTDLAFAGVPERAFVCLSQEDRILVIDPAAPEGSRPSIPLQGSDPRSLALSPDGNTLYVTIHDSGNETTAIPFATVEALGGPPAPDPPTKRGATGTPYWVTPCSIETSSRSTWPVAR
jgi:YVTN family beta-propeller protein